VTVPSPCINVCKMSPSTGWCEGCRRTLDEIAAWGGMDDEGKWRVWEMLEQRGGAEVQAVASEPSTLR
jgi:uncharacterized protein